jgi:hypothetical protein
VNPLFLAAAHLQEWCAGRGWRCCVIGGLAVQRWGEPRQTRDVDLTLLTGMVGSEEAARRVKDRESLPRLKAFREYLRERDARDR